jgi:hypothetical protein
LSEEFERRWNADFCFLADAIAFLTSRSVIPSFVIFSWIDARDCVFEVIFAGIALFPFFLPLKIPYRATFSIAPKTQG